MNALPSTSSTRIAEIGFVALLLLMFVTLHPFVPPPHLAEIGNIHQQAGGDGLRQVCYLAAFFLVLAGAFADRRTVAFQAVPLLLALLLAWCIASSLWAEESGVVFRRAVLATIVTLSTLISVETLGYERAFRLLRIVLVCILVVNWLSIPLIHTAVHLSDETDQGLVGNWRGLYSQKNTAGAICAMTILLFLFQNPDTRKQSDIFVILGAAGFLVMTHSKTSLGLLPIAAVAGGIYRVAWRKGIDRAIALCIAAAVLLLAGIFVWLNIDWLARLVEDPREFTGRAEIWQADFAYIHDHFLRGAGFGTVAGTDGPSFLRNYISDAWVLAIGDSHNGYLQVFVELGVIGFTLAMLALIVQPLWYFLSLEDADMAKAGLFALFVFIALHDFTESDFLESDNTAWFVFLLVIAELSQRNRRLSFLPIPAGTARQPSA